MTSTFTISEDQVLSAFNDENPTPFPTETDHAFSNQCTTYSLNMPEMLPSRSGDDQRLCGTSDFGVGKNVREAVAIVKDWMR
jgi:hypothetical protein